MMVFRISLNQYRAWGQQFCCCLALMCAPQSFANGKFGGSLGVTSDYVSYGLSQTRGEAAIQADAHYQMPLSQGATGIFAGAFASTLNSNRWDEADFELDAYIGGTWRIDEGSSATLTVTHYEYPGEPSRRKYDYNEISLTGGFANQRLFGTIAWSPNTQRYVGAPTARCCRKLSYEVAAHQPLAHRFTAIVGAGYADWADATGYGYWNAGISRMLGDAELNLSYIGTQDRAKDLFSEAVAGSRWAASAVWRWGGR